MLTEEGAILLEKKARTAFGQGKYSESVMIFEQIKKELPSFSGNLRVHLFLGLTYRRLGKLNQAINPLRYYAEALSHTPEGSRALLTLAHTYTDLKKYHEALWAAEEIISSKSRAPEVVQLEAVIVKGRAWLGLKKVKRSKRAIDSFFIKTKNRSDLKKLKAQAYLLSMDMTLYRCEKYPKSQKRAEIYIREQIKERGECLLEALVQYIYAVEQGNPNLLLQGGQRFKSSFQKYNYLCKSPPKPPGKRTAKQLRQYREEISKILKTDCDQVRNRGIALLVPWYLKVPRDFQVYLDQASYALEKGRNHEE